MCHVAAHKAETKSNLQENLCRGYMALPEASKSSAASCSSLALPAARRELDCKGRSLGTPVCRLPSTYWQAQDLRKRVLADECKKKSNYSSYSTTVAWEQPSPLAGARFEGKWALADECKGIITRLVLLTTVAREQPIRPGSKVEQPTLRLGWNAAWPIHKSR